jgi:hypothetical protein
MLKKQWNTYVLSTTLGVAKNFSIAIGNPPLSVRANSATITLRTAECSKSFIEMMSNLGYKLKVVGLYPTYMILNCKVPKDMSFEAYCQLNEINSALIGVLPYETNISTEGDQNESFIARG